MASSPAGLRVVDISTACQKRYFSSRVWAWAMSSTFSDGPEFKTLEAGIVSYLESVHSEQHTLDLTGLDISKDGKQLFEEEKPKINRLWRKFLAWQFVGLLALAAALLLYPPALTAIRDAHNAEALTALICAIIVLVELTSYVVHRWIVYNECMRPRASDLLKTDKRRPVLLIRSFLDDGAQIYQYVKSTGSDGMSMWSVKATRFEEAFTPALGRFGPVIAVGSPREELPEAGAARAHFTDAVWKQPVLDMIQQSRLIVLVSGMKPGTADETRERLASGDLFSALDLTPGVKWEVEHIMSSEYQDKLLILVKPDRPSIRDTVRSLGLVGRWWLNRAPEFAPRDIVALHCPRKGEPLVLTYGLSIHSPEIVERAITLTFSELFCRAPSPASESPPLARAV